MIKVLAVFASDESSESYLKRLKLKYPWLSDNTEDAILYNVKAFKLKKDFRLPKTFVKNLDKLYVDADSVTGKKNMDLLFELRNQLPAHTSMFWSRISTNKAKLTAIVDVPVFKMKNDKSGWGK